MVLTKVLARYVLSAPQIRSTGGWWPFLGPGAPSPSASAPPPCTAGVSPATVGETSWRLFDVVIALPRRQRLRGRDLTFTLPWHHVSRPIPVRLPTWDRSPPSGSLDLREHG